MTEWKKYKLGDLLDVKRGASLSGEYYATEGQYIRLTCGNFDYNQNCFKENTSKDNIFYIGQVRPEFIMKKGDIITPLTEQAIGLLGSTAIIPESDKYIQSQDVAKIICKDGKLYPAFAFYLVSSTMVKTQLSAGAQQTKIRHTSPDKIKDCFVWIPDYETQKRIASVLSNIDRKIALNRAMNEELEQTARDLYDYWFLQFDFPDANGKPYRSSGGKMVYNPQLKREIPEGWEVKELKDIETNIVTGKTPSTSDSTNFGGAIPFITIDDIRGNLFVPKTARTLTTKGADGQKTKYLPADSLCCSCIGTVGVIGFTSKISQTNQQINSIIFDKESNKEYLYFALSNYFANARVKTGNTFANMSRGDFSIIPILAPHTNIVNDFHTKLLTLFTQIKSLILEIDHLTSLRDELLPLLMNGQVTIE